MTVCYESNHYFLNVKIINFQYLKEINTMATQVSCECKSFLVNKKAIHQPETKKTINQQPTSGLSCCRKTTDRTTFLQKYFPSCQNFPPLVHLQFSHVRACIPHCYTHLLQPILLLQAQSCV